MITAAIVLLAAVAIVATAAPFRRGFMRGWRESRAASRARRSDRAG